MASAAVLRTSVRHIVLPGQVIAVTPSRRRETIAGFLRRTKWSRHSKRYGWQFTLPTICVVNGEPVLQKHWRTTRIRAGDSVEFWSRPLGGQGGSGKQVLGIVALVAVAALTILAPYAAGAGYFGAWAATNLAANTVGGALLSLGIGVGGSLLVNSLIAPRAGARNQDSAGSSSGTDQVLASIQASGNQIKPFSPIPVTYGRLKDYPDFAATPWSEYVGNDQYLNVLLSLGMGKYSSEAIYLDDTLLWDSSTGVQPGFTANIEFYDPGQTVTLFPTNVVSSGSVSGQEILATASGWVAASAPGKTASSLAVDMVFPGGLYIVPANAADSTQIGSAYVTVAAEYQEINDAGAPIGSVATLFVEQFNAAIRNPWRVSRKIDVTPKRYQVRVYRTDNPGDPNTSTGPKYRGGTPGAIIDNVAWAGLRAFVTGIAEFPVSTCAVQIKADRINANSARKIAVTRTRKLNVWTGSEFVEQSSRNPLWAFYDAVTNAEYGASRPASKIDFNTIVTEAAAADLRGDCFDYTFASAVIVPDAFDTILRTTRARHFWSGDVLSVVRDEERTVPDMLLTDREIVRGTLSYDTIINDDQSSDSVRIEYVDEDTWQPADVQYPPDSESFTAENPATIRIDGVVQREKALEHAAFFYLQSIYRRQSVRLDTEWEGRRLAYGAHVRVQSELPQSWGQSGAILSVVTNTLTADPAPSWADAGSKYVRIRTKAGRVFGPVLCTRGADDSQIVLDGTDLASVETAQSITLAQAVAREDGGEPPSFEFGTATRTARDCIALSGRPSGDNRLSLELAVDNPLIYSTDIGDPPVLPGGNLPAAVVTPQISGLTASFRQGVAEPILEASWFPAEGAQYYRGRVSYDGGATFVQIYEGFSAQLSSVVDRGSLELQVAGIGRNHGPWTSILVDAPVIRVSEQTVDVVSLYSGLRDWVDGQVAAELAEIRAEIDDISLSVANALAMNWVDKKLVRSDIVASEGRSTASVSTLQTALVNDEAAFAAYQITITSQFADVNAAITSESATRSSQDTAIANSVSSLTTTVNANTAAISSEQTARTTQDTALSNSITSLTTTVTNNYNTLNAAITNESSARSTQDTAFANSLATLTATVNGHTASITTAQSAIATIDGHLTASWGVTLDVNNHVTGIRLLSDGTTGLFSINADVLIDGSLTAQKIQSGTINASKIAVNGVDILNIVDGATTALAYASGADVAVSLANTSSAVWSYAGSQTAELASVSLTPKTGIVRVDLQTVFRYLVQATNDYQGTDYRPTWFHGIQLLVNGYVTNTWTIDPLWSPNPSNSVRSDWYCAKDFYRSYIVSGLGSSPVTFSMRTILPASGYGPVLTGYTHYQNLITVFERRR